MYFILDILYLYRNKKKINILYKLYTIYTINSIKSHFNYII